MQSFLGSSVVSYQSSWEKVGKICVLSFDQGFAGYSRYCTKIHLIFSSISWRGAVCNKIICFRWFIIRALKNIVKGGLFGSENTGIFWIYKKRNYYSQYDESQEWTFKGSVSNRIEISFKEGSQSQKFDGNNYYPFVDIDLYTKEKDLKEWNSTVPFFFCVSTSIHMSNFEKPVYEQDPVMSLRTQPVY